MTKQFYFYKMTTYLLQPNNPLKTTGNFGYTIMSQNSNSQIIPGYNINSGISGVQTTQTLGG